MIELSAAARGDVLLQHFADDFKPTHARCVSANVSSVGEGTLSATYWFGRLNAEGEFVYLQAVPVQAIQLPHVRDPIVVADDFRADETRPVLVTRDEMRTILRNLLAADVVPDAADPRIERPLPGKHAGDWKTRDIDAIAAYVEPRLGGTVL